MKTLEVVRPETLDEAVASLSELGEAALPIAGGTAVALMYTQGFIHPRYLVDLGRLSDLAYIDWDDREGLRIGALTTHREVETSPIVRQWFPYVAEVFHGVANVRVRYQATVGGALAEADYASDPPAALMALNASVRAVGPEGSRTIPVSELISGYLETTLKAGELITEVRIPPLARECGAAYLKFTSRSAEDRPCAGVAAVVSKIGPVCESLRVVVGAVASRPQSVPDIDRMASGERLSDSLARQIAALYAEHIQPISDLRGSAWYRKQVIDVLVRKAIARAGGIR